MSKRVLKQDRRGGRRENAGRKPIWKNKHTITIRVPKLIATKVLELAHRLDSETDFDLDTESKLPKDDCVIQSNLPEVLDNEKITKSNFTSQNENGNLKSDFDLNSHFPETEKVTKSKISRYEAVEMAKKILKEKKSARISLAKLLSIIYSLTLSPDDLK